jgi:hypothetical protein
VVELVAVDQVHQVVLVVMDLLQHHNLEALLNLFMDLQMEFMLVVAEQVKIVEKVPLQVLVVQVAEAQVDQEQELLEQLV